jgi:hypothetical protein
MKKLLYTFLLIVTGLIGLNSCKEEVDLIGDFQETAIVYGLLDQADSVHMIKINRAFIGPGDAYEIAQIPDSSYFQSVVATVSEVDNQGTIYRTWTLNDTTIQDKEPGVFFSPEQKMYVFYTDPSTPLLSDKTYQLNIDINNGQFQVSGETELVSGISTSTDNINYQFKFVDNDLEYRATTMSTDVGNSYIINGALDIHYSEFIATAETPRTFTWTLGEIECQPNDTKIFTANGQSFYELVAAHCENEGDPLSDKRNYTGITVRMVGGAQDLYLYMLANEPTSGVAQNKPTFTNLSATNGHPVIGIFSSRFTFEYYHPFESSISQNIRSLDKNSTRNLCIGAVTGPYLFCSQHIKDATPTLESWACN